MSHLGFHYAVSDIEARLLAAIRAAGLDPELRLTPEDLAPLDQFHTGGLSASRELMGHAGIRAEHRVLDIGAGLAGPARLMASSVGCRVDCIDMSREFCKGAELLNRLTGLTELVRIFQGNALALPFHDHEFDVVWMQNVGMNIADKTALYREIFRVVKPGGCFAFQEMAAGLSATTYFPLPWASVPADSCLATPDEMALLLGKSGFAPELFEDISEAHLARPSSDGPPCSLSLAVYVENLSEKARNARRSLQEGQIRLIRGVFRTR